MRSHIRPCRDISSLPSKHFHSISGLITVNHPKKTFSHLGHLGHLGHLDQLGHLGHLDHLGHLGHLDHLGHLGHLSHLGHLDHLGHLGHLDYLGHLGVTHLSHLYRSFTSLGHCPRLRPWHLSR